MRKGFQIPPHYLLQTTKCSKPARQSKQQIQLNPWFRTSFYTQMVQTRLSRCPATVQKSLAVRKNQISGPPSS